MQKKKLVAKARKVAKKEKKEYPPPREFSSPALKKILSEARTTDTTSAKWKRWQKDIAKLIKKPRVCGGKAGRQRGMIYPCPNWRVMANGRCRMHGGHNREPGPTHPAFQTGRYSKVLHGKAIYKLYEEARNDPRLLALTEEIHLLIAQQKQTLSKLSTNEYFARLDSTQRATTDCRGNSERIPKDVPRDVPAHAGQGNSRGRGNRR